MYDTIIDPSFVRDTAFQHYAADRFPSMNPVHWLYSHFAVGGWSPLQRLSGMLTAHMTQIAPRNGFGWHPHRGLEIYTWVLEGTLYHEDTTGGKGEIAAGELQRMFSGNYIEHQELNLRDEKARVIQIWFASGIENRGIAPHYQQVGRGDLPARMLGDATIYSLVGDDSPMDRHVDARITAAVVPAGGVTSIEAPREGEDLFLYVTDGIGSAKNGHEVALGQYDVLLARPEVENVSISAGEQTLNFMSFYLPSFL